MAFASSLSNSGVPADAGRYADLGWRCLQLGRFAESEAHMRRAFACGSDSAWIGLCHALAQQGKDAELVDLLRLVSPDRAQAAETLFCIFNNRGAVSDWDGMARLNARLPAIPVLKMVGSYWMGCLFARRNEFEESALAYQDAIRQALRSGLDLGSNELFRRNILSCQSIEPSTSVLAEDDRSSFHWPPVEPLIDLRHGADACTGVLFASCDAFYFQKYGHRFLSSIRDLGALAESLIVEINVVNPDHDTVEMIRQVRELVPTINLVVTTEVVVDRPDPVYFASNRFLHLNRLQRRYGLDLVVVDIDIEVTARLLSLFVLCRDFDVALFEVDTIFPWLRYLGGVLYVRHDQEGHRFARPLANFMSRKLGGLRNWFLDQAALWCTIESLRLRRPDFAFGVLNGITGGPLTEIVHLQIAAESNKEAREEFTRRAPPRRH